MTDYRTISIRRKPYFYDEQIKRYLVQIMSMFSGYTVETGIQRDGKTRVLDVGVLNSTYDRMVSEIINGQNLNKVGGLPLISIEMNSLRQDGSQRRYAHNTKTYHYSDRNVNMHERNPENLTTEDETKKIAVDSFQPTPYEMGISLHLWASNEDQAMQIYEQILQQFNPSLDLQLSNSPLDWMGQCVVKFDGDLNKTRGAIDIGGGTGETQNHTYRLDFTVSPVLIAPPSRVRSAEYVNQINVTMKQWDEDVANFDKMTNLEHIVIRGSSDDNQE